MTKETSRLKCVNFMNQVAIDEALEKANESLRRQGDTEETLYKPGTNCCVQCDYGLGMETSEMMNYLRMVAGHSIKRVCYKEPK